VKNKYALLIIAALFFYSCRNGKTTESPVSLVPVYLDTLKSVSNQADLYVEQTDSNDFLSLNTPLFKWFDPWMLPDYGAQKTEDFAHVYYRDTVIPVFNSGLDSGAKILVIKSDKGDSAEFYSYYTDFCYYLKQIKEINSYLVVSGDPDQMIFSLINKTTGRKSDLNGYPLLSPDNKTIFCFPRECNGSEACVSFYIYSVSGDSVTLQYQKQTTFPGHPDLKWKDAQTAYLRITNVKAYESDKDFVSKTWFAKIKMPGLQKFPNATK